MTTNTDNLYVKSHVSRDLLQSAAHRTAAHRWAVSQRPAKEDRLVLACTKCPVSQKSRRRSIRWGHVAKELGVTLPALRAAIETERRRE